MFERYTEKARRAIFFARYEASQFLSPFIETEHLLLGVLREDERIAQHLKIASTEAIRSQIAARGVRERVSATIDLPLTDESKGVLKYAMEEADQLKHKHIGPEHLLLGLAREKKSFAAKLLRENGFNAEQFREHLAKPDTQEKWSNRDTADYSNAVRIARGPRRTLEDITIHGQPRNADFVRRSVKKLREISWHWQKREWTPRDVVLHRKTRALSFDTSLAEDKKHFELVKEGWTRDYCKICHWDLFASQDEPEHSTGYTNGRDWLCVECYEKFLARDDYFSSSYPELT
ncbi:MAG TPA: Clp protease N-terminal domain-containing protein [Terriglobales bacterium]|nr:Clp protease N-terminal domain-containing protein [Terriglobales bacterium]